MSERDRKTILLVEDEIIISAAESSVIRKFGYDVVTANTGEAAVETVFSDTKIDLVLMDIGLGEGIDGPEAARRILEKINIPIVFLTSHIEREYVDRVKKITRYGYVIKNSGDFVLRSSIEMAFELFEAKTKEKGKNDKYDAAEELQKSEAQKKAILNGITTNLAFVDNDLKIIWVNNTAARSVNKSPEEMVGQACHKFWGDPSKPCKNCPTLKAFQTKKTEQTIIHTPDGRIWEEKGEPVFDSDGNLIGVLEIAADITESKIAEGKIKTLLSEKSLMLKEVHHRVKNNMNTVASLLALQESIVKDEPAAAALKDSRNRVVSMMMLYDKLYRSDDFKETSFKEYISPLVDEIVNNFPNRTKAKIEKNIDDFRLDAKKTSSLGIIVNELLTNIMKYAFTGRQTGLITISSAVNNNRAAVIVRDDGIGMPESIDITKSDGFGLQLVELLTEQIGGSIKIERDNGTKFTLEFNL